MIRTLYRSSKGGFTIDVPPSHWRVALHDEGGVFWVDFSEEPAERVEPFLRDPFDFHALAIDDTLHELNPPKVDNWGSFVYLTVRDVDFDQASLELTQREVDIFLGANFIVTHHARAVRAVNRLWTNLQTDQRRMELGPDHLLYELLDLITADYLPAVDALDEVIDRIEDEVFARPAQSTLNKIFSLKRAILHLRRIIGPQREVLNRLARDEYPFIDAKDRVYFRDVYDHLVRLVDLTESLRDLIGGTLDTYLSVVSNRTNEIMKTLTITSVLFLPISFLAGFFGMNFLDIPFDRAGLLVVAVLSMVATPAAMLLWFRHRRWL
jgi:magnesium transporter